MPASADSPSRRSGFPTDLEKRYGTNAKAAATARRAAKKLKACGAGSDIHGPLHRR